MRCYFDIRDGQTLIEDPEGGEFPTLDAARSEAIQVARELMIERLKAGRPLVGPSIEIRAEGKALLGTVSFQEAIPVR